MRLTKHVYLVGSGEIGVSHQNDCHVYLIDTEEEAVLIDAGVGLDTQTIIQNVEQYIPFEKVTKVILTHTHADHGGGAPDFQQLGKQVVVPEIEAELMTNHEDDVELALQLAKNAGAYPSDYSFKYFEPDQLVKDCDELKVGDLTLKAIQVRGHSPGLSCYFLEESDGNKVLFSSDAVFAHGLLGLLNAPGSSLQDYREDFHKIENLNVDTLLPGHRLFILKRGNEHIQNGAEQLTKVFTPNMF
ncbi:MBL fold metallo-hydrolase [Bacillus shivajii]|uniref:MBL fold metallo-hydrolase n=1 Tax=Bacillus shivajii TaxID=1983719 RepID=UPI001CF94E74|nr:MBL fold metallo-hydrolase [Bacillus shivajii]UCZ55402.1 MBL fold metallo-hydrolase [Bacillus shivajii]